MSEEKIAELTNEISQLRDLFVRRLYEDKNGKAAVEALVKQNELLNYKLYERNIESIVKELILVCDRIEAGSSDSDFADSIKDEIIDIFARRNIFPIDANEADGFEPEYHKAVKTVAADEKYPHGTIVSVLRKGYISNGRVLRPAEVVVAVEEKASEHTNL